MKETIGLFYLFILLVLTWKKEVWYILFVVSLI